MNKIDLKRRWVTLAAPLAVVVVLYIFSDFTLRSVAERPGLLKPQQLASLAVLLWSIFAWIDITAGQKISPLLAVVPLSWLVHALAFYLMIVAREFVHFPFPISFTAWSGFVRLHAVLLAAGLITIEWLEYKGIILE